MMRFLPINKRIFYLFHDAKLINRIPAPIGMNGAAG
jgi:hypothetical protein